MASCSPNTVNFLIAAGGTLVGAVLGFLGSVRAGVLVYRREVVLTQRARILDELLPALAEETAQWSLAIYDAGEPYWLCRNKTSGAGRETRLRVS